MGWIHGNENVEPFVGSAGTPRPEAGPVEPVRPISQEEWAVMLQNGVEEYLTRWEEEATEGSVAVLMGWFEKRNEMAFLANLLSERGWLSLATTTEMVVALECAQRSLLEQY